MEINFLFTLSSVKTTSDLVHELVLVRRPISPLGAFEMKSYCYDYWRFLCLYICWKIIQVYTGQIVSQGMFFLGNATKWSQFDRYLVKLDITRLIHVSCFLFRSFRCCYTFRSFRCCYTFGSFRCCYTFGSFRCCYTFGSFRCCYTFILMMVFGGRLVNFNSILPPRKSQSGGKNSTRPLVFTSEI